MNRRLFFGVLLGFPLLALTGCGGGGETTTDDQQTEVVATSTMVADMVRVIAGPDIKVIGLIAPGVDPHTYEPGARVYSDLRNADAIIYNGMHLEGKLTETFEKQGEKAIAISASLPKDRLISPEDIDEEYGDPHIWGDASLWALTIPAVVKKLSELLPEKSADFQARGDAYQKEINELHTWAKARIEEIPEGGRVLITSHDAFNYFGKAYGIKVFGVQGISTVDEAGLADITNTVDLIKTKGVKAIFPESSVPPNVIKTIATDAGVKVGEELFSDSCGELGKMETHNGETYDLGTYIGMMKHNVNTIVDALK